MMEEDSVTDLGFCTLHESKEVVSNTTTTPPAANGDIMMNLSSVIKKCEDLEREITELKEMIKLLRIK